MPTTQRQANARQCEGSSRPSFSREADDSAATASPPSLPGLTPQVGFTRLAALECCGTRACPRSVAIHLLRKNVSCEADRPPNSGLPEFGFLSCAKSDQSDLRGQARG